MSDFFDAKKLKISVDPEVKSLLKLIEERNEKMKELNELFQNWIQQVQAIIPKFENKKEKWTF